MIECFITAVYYISALLYDYLLQRTHVVNWIDFICNEYIWLM